MAFIQRHFLHTWSCQVMPGPPPPSCFIKPESYVHCLYKCHLFCLARPVFNLRTSQILSTSLPNTFTKVLIFAPFESSTIINMISLNIHKWCVLKLTLWDVVIIQRLSDCAGILMKGRRSELPTLRNHF